MHGAYTLGYPGMDVSHAPLGSSVGLSAACIPLEAKQADDVFGVIRHKAGESSLVQVTDVTWGRRFGKTKEERVARGESVCVCECMHVVCVCVCVCV